MNTATGAHRNPDKTLSKLKSGDDCAFNELVQSHWEKIYNRANGLLGNRQDAEEVAQDTFFASKKKHLQFQGRLLHINLAIPYCNQPCQKQTLVLVEAETFAVCVAGLPNRRK